MSYNVVLVSGIHQSESVLQEGFDITLDCIKKFLFMVDDLALSDWDEGVKIYPEKQDIHSTRLAEINLNPW